MKLTMSFIFLLFISGINGSRLLQQTACTQDAQACCDGSFVSRQPPSCQFDQCPCQHCATCTDDACSINYGGCASNEECSVDLCSGCEAVCTPCNNVVNCFANPCDNYACPDGQQCVANYCGGCNAICTDPVPVDVCSLPQDSGPCEALIPRWYYNSATGNCEQFNFGGCGGNGNNFETRKDCRRECK